MLEAVEIRTRLLRDHERAVPRVLLPAAVVAGWEPTEGLAVEVAINGVSLGCRPLKRGDDANWTILIPLPLCEQAQVRPEEVVLVRLRLDPRPPPEELLRLIGSSPEARSAWDKLAVPNRREVVRITSGGRTAATRWARAAKALGLHVGVPEDLRVAAPRHAPLEIVVVPVFTPDAAERHSEALKLLAHAFVDLHMYDVWREFVIKRGRDPDHERPPPEVAGQWHEDLKQRFGKNYLEKLRSKQ